MKNTAGSSAGGDYPHIVVKNGTRSAWRMSVSVEIGEAFADLGTKAVLRHPRPFAPDGSLTGPARRLLLAAAAVPDAIGPSPYMLCLVWGPDDCTFINADCQITDSDHPPYVRPFYAHLGATLPPLPIERCFSIEVPAKKGAPSRYICAQRIGRLVEIVEGEQMVLGHLPDEDIPVTSDGFELSDAEVLRMLPKSYRGAPITGYIAGGLLGPVQPMETAISIVLQDPWPDEVDRACDQIAGRTLPSSVKDAVWSAVRQRRPALLRAA